MARDLITVVSASGLSVSEYISGNQQSTLPTNSTGYAIFSCNFTSKSNYNVTFVSATNTNHNSATSYNPISVFLNTAITIQAGTVIVDQQNSMTVTLKDQNGNLLSSRTVGVSINGVSFANVTTGSNGQASFNWSPSITGDYTVAASYSATGSLDTGFMPASSSTIVNVKPQMIINTQTTGSGTQSVTFNTAQGSVQSSTGGLSVSIQYSFGSATVTLSFNGMKSQATVKMWNEYGWTCVARVLGSCVLSVPYMKTHEDMGVPSVFDLHLASFVPFGPSTASDDINIPIPTDEASADLAVVASGFCAGVGSAIIIGSAIATGALADAAAVGVGGLAVAACLDASILAPTVSYLAGTTSKASLKSFLAGLILSIPAGILCAVGACPPEVGTIAPVETLQAAAYAWGILFPLLLIPFAIEGLLALISIGVVLLLAVLLYYSI